MTTMERLVEAYLEKERVINEQVQEILTLNMRVKRTDELEDKIRELNREVCDLKVALREEEEANRWAKEIAGKVFYGRTITKEDREKGERFKSRLIGYQTPEYSKHTDPPPPLKVDPKEAEEIDKKFRETLG